MTGIICAICGKKQQTRLLYKATFSEKDLSSCTYSARRLPDRIHYDIRECKNCGLVFSSSILDPSKISNLYRESLCSYGEQIPYLKKTYLELFKKIESFLPKNPKILEIGCGNGFFLKELKNKGFMEVFGVEPSHKMVSQADSYIKKRILVDIFRPGQFKKNTFDLVCCFHTLDHVVDPNEFIKETLSILKSGGLALFVVHDTKGLSVKLFGERSPIFDIEHIYLFDKRTLSKIFSMHGFKIIKVLNVTNTYPLFYWWRMSGFPRSIKKIGDKILSIGIGKLSLSLSGGNIGIITRKN